MLGKDGAGWPTGRPLPYIVAVRLGENHLPGRLRYNASA
jgi:hypothetical protein